MKRWLYTEFSGSAEQETFVLEFNRIALSLNNSVYFKVFGFKKKDRGFKLFIADEGSLVVDAIQKKFQLKEVIPPPRVELKRIAGFSSDRDWMFDCNSCYLLE